MKKTKLIFSRYFLISFVIHLTVISLVIYLILETETDISTPSIEIGLIDSPAGDVKDSAVKKNRAPKITERQAKKSVQSRAAKKSYYPEKTGEKESTVEKKLPESGKKAEKADESRTAMSDSSSFNTASHDKSSNLILAHPDYKYNPKPKYPMVAKRRGYEGTVLLNVYVLESGRVGELTLEKASGFTVLDESAINSVKEWIFVPGKRNGISVSSWVQVPIKFQLNNI